MQLENPAEPSEASPRRVVRLLELFFPDGRGLRNNCGQLCWMFAQHRADWLQNTISQEGASLGRLGSLVGSRVGH